MTPSELKEQAEAISFWIADENASARKELEQRRPELDLWLQKVEALVRQKLAEREVQEEVRAKV